MKSGTTSLYRYLRAHPDVFMSRYKEITFFSNNWERGQSWYESFFESAGHEKAIGEASPQYTMYPHVPHVPERIASMIPRTRIVYVVRDPIERMRSHYAHMVASGQEHRPIGVALIEDPLYSDLSSYWLQLTRFLDYFAKDQILVVRSEWMLNDRHTTMRNVFDFLGVDPAIGTEALAETHHQTSDRRRLHPAVHYLRQVRGVSSLVDLLPRSTRDTLKRFLLYRPYRRGLAEDSLRIDPVVKATLVERLAEDSRDLAVFLGEG
jgi:hypothetical protein